MVHRVGTTTRSVAVPDAHAGMRKPHTAHCIPHAHVHGADYLRADVPRVRMQISAVDLPVPSALTCTPVPVPALAPAAGPP